MSAEIRNAGYFPEWMVIRLPMKYRWIFENQTSKTAWTENQARDLGIFFHEWIHHLHNTSTASGIFSYTVTVGLWSSFRWTVTDGCDSSGSDCSDLSTSHRINIERAASYFDAIRNKRSANETLNEFSTGFSFFTEEFAISEKVVASLPTFDGGTTASEDVHVISCNARRIRPDRQAYQNLEIEIGTVEILEGVASMLERRLVRAIKPCAALEPSDFAPYQLLSNFVSAFISDSDEPLAIACGIAALQHPDPPLGLLMLVRAAAKLPSPDRMALIEKNAKSFLKASEGNILSHLANVDTLFPIDEPMGEAVKWINDSIRLRLAERLSTPFFEFELISAIATEPSAILDKILARSCSLLFLSTSKEDSSEQLAMMYELRPPYAGRDEEDFKYGRLKLWSALHFLHHHRKLGGIRSSTEVLRESGHAAVSCPLYYVCEKPPRLAKNFDCKKAPWRVGSETDRGKALCWYHDAAVASRRGPVIENSPNSSREP